MQKNQIAVIAASILILIFMVQNTEPAAVNFLFWTLSMPIVVLIAIVLFIGIGLGAYLGRNRRS